MTLSPLGDSAVVLEMGQNPDEATANGVRALAADLRRDRPAGVLDVVPAFTTLAVTYDPARIAGFEALCTELRSRADRIAGAPAIEEARLVEIPVCYGGEFGPDLDAVGSHAGVSVAEAVALHCGAEYRVHAIGFVPGFPYLGGLPARLHMPRRATPRTRVPAGSVGIGGAQTGIYPFAVPGGWNLIGRTPLVLFRTEAEPPALLSPGDRVRFRAITPEAFAKWT